MVTATKVAAEIEGDLEMGLSGEVVHELVLEPEWIDGDYRVVIEGVLLDYNGHEQRAASSMSIGRKTKDCNLRLALQNRCIEAGKDFTVEIEPLDEEGHAVTASASIVAVRLEPNGMATHNPWDYGYGYGYYNSYSHRPIRNLRTFPQMNSRNPGWRRVASTDVGNVLRSVVTAIPAIDGVASLSLTQPGPYKLICFAQLPDGRRLQNEIGCIVHEKEDLPSLILKLDCDELSSGQTLSGEIHSRFRNGRVLLTVRDSSGVRYWKVIDVAGSGSRFEEKLPDGLRYGCYVQVQCVNAERLFSEGKFIRVEPVDRIVKIDVKHDEVYGPGDEVTLDLSVDRKEPVDMVVSVYDQSLLGIASDKAVDIRNFYLADERIGRAVTHERLRQILGDITVRELIERAEKLLKENEQLVLTPEGSEMQTLVSNYRHSHRIFGMQLDSLFQLAGIDSDAGDWLNQRFGWNWYWDVTTDREAENPARLFDVVTLEQEEWKMHFRFAGDTLVYFPSSKTQFEQWSQVGWLNNGLMHRGGYGVMSARGDARFSVSANSAMSIVPGISGQAFISHMPSAAEPVALISSDDPGISVRRDFSDSAFWQANVRTDNTGHAKVSFKLPDSLTNWRVAVTAISPRMHVGQASTSFRTFKPVMVWPILPRVFTEGDTVEVCAAVHNRTKKAQQMDVSLKIQNGSLGSPMMVRVDVPAESQMPVSIPVVDLPNSVRRGIRRRHSVQGRG